jgi:hypothetical protein
MEFRNDDHPVAIEEYGRSQPVGSAYHFVCRRCKAGWLTRRCQTTAWKALGQGRYPAWIDLGDEHDHIAVLGGISAVATHDAEHFCRARFGQIEGLNDVGADLALGIPAADGIDQDSVLVTEMTGIEPRRKHRVPSFVVGARGKLRDVVDRAIGLDAAELAKVVDGVAAVGSAAADADQKQPSPAVAQPIKFGCEGLDGSK